MARLMPDIPYSLNANKREAVAMRGVNFSDALQDGDMADSKNLSARRYPYIATRHARAKQEEYSGCTALSAWSKLVAVCGTQLLYDGVAKGSVLPGPKQFAVVNTKLVIWPDKVYLDLNTLQLMPLGAQAHGSGAVFTENSMTVSWPGVDLTQIFRPGDGLRIYGCAEESNNKSFVAVLELTANSITVPDNTFTAATETAGISLAREIPDLDFICESENRLWGCSSATQTIYASGLGDPTNFNVFQGLATDSYAVPVGSEGEFTGCCRLSSSVLFWKQNKLHKVLGSYPAEYALYSYDIEGLRAGCHKSMQVINEVLFYMGLHGVYTFTGGTPSLISANFGEKVFTEAVAGNDGDSYYLSVRDGDVWRLMVYETRSGIWIHEEELQAVDFARVGKDLFFADAAGDVWLADAGYDDAEIEWYAQFTPFYESIQGRKIYSRLLLRVELPVKSYMLINIRTDGGPWREIGRVVGRSVDAIPLRIPLTRCDKFELRLTGKGPCAILSFMREFNLGSEV